MALINCSECGKEISNKAELCPDCGAPTKIGKKKSKKAAQKARIKDRSNKQGAGCLLILVAIVLGFTVVGLPFAIVLGAVGLIVMFLGFLPA